MGPKSVLNPTYIQNNRIYKHDQFGIQRLKYETNTKLPTGIFENLRDIMAEDPEPD